VTYRLPPTINTYYLFVPTTNHKKNLRRCFTYLVRWQTDSTPLFIDLVINVVRSKFNPGQLEILSKRLPDDHRSKETWKLSLDDPRPSFSWKIATRYANCDVINAIFSILWIPTYLFSTDVPTDLHSGRLNLQQPTTTLSSTRHTISVFSLLQIALLRFTASSSRKLSTITDEKRTDNRYRLCSAGGSGRRTNQRRRKRPERIGGSRFRDRKKNRTRVIDRRSWTVYASVS